MIILQIYKIINILTWMIILINLWMKVYTYTSSVGIRLGKFIKLNLI